MPVETAEATAATGGSEAPPTTSAVGRGDTNQGAGSGGSQAGDPSVEAAYTELLGKERYDKLKSDPDALVRELHRSYTQKTQALSVDRDFLNAWQEDAEGTIRRMAEQYGYDLQPRKDEKAAITDEIVDNLKGTLGEEAVDQLATLIQKTVERVFDQKVGPIRQSTAELEAETALRQVEALESRFEAAYPDYRKFEAQMESLAKELVLAPGGDPYVWMERLYKLAKEDAAVGDKARELVDKQTKAARGSERPTPGVPPAHVAHAPVVNGKVDFRDAWALAKAGKTIDPDEVRRLKREQRNR